MEARRRRSGWSSLGPALAVGALLFCLVALRPEPPPLVLDPDASAEEVREACHRVLRAGAVHHDCCLSLETVGNEETVPLLIAALESAPPRADPWPCTWAHCLDALQAITNQRLGRDRAAWREWHAANRHATRLEWIADGFASRGVEVGTEGTAQGCRRLLAAAGSLEGPRFEPRNATLLLASYDRDLVAAEAVASAGSGRPAEKRGAIRLAAGHPFPGHLALLRQLAEDEDRSVRVLALSRLATLRAESVTNPAGLDVGEIRLDLHPFRRGALSADHVLYLPITFDRFAAYDLETGRRLWLASLSGGPGAATLDGDDLYFALSDGSLQRWRRSDGALVWTSPRTSPRDLFAWAAPICHGEHVVFSAVHGEGAVFVCEKASGREVASARGDLLAVRDGIAVAASGSTVHVYALPALVERTSFTLDGEVVGAALHGGVAALLATSADTRASPSTGGPAWIEGRSLETGSRLWGPMRLCEDRVRIDGGIMQDDSGLCFASQGGLVTAMRIADGTVLWEAAPEGRLHHVRDRIVLAADPDDPLRGLCVLDPRDGSLLARLVGGAGYHDNVFVEGDDLVAVDMDETLHVFRLPAAGG